MTNPRYLAVELLNKTFRSGSYSNIQLSHGLNSADMSDRDKRLCSVIYYGVIERKITLDHIIGGLSSRPVDKLDDTVLNILRCGIYQLLFMEAIPDNAAVNESVDLAKKFGKTSASGMVNAILRNFIRHDKVYPITMDIIHSAEIMYSAPLWLVEGLCSDYGTEKMTELLSDALDKPPVTIRANNTKCSEAELFDSLDGISAEKDEKIPQCYILGKGDPTATSAFEKGFFHVQDRASQLCCMALAPDKNDRVLDICAAPGGKTFTIAEMMNGRGEIYAFDLHEKRVRLIRDGAKRLGLENIKAMCGDASVFNPELPKFSKILCDVPCSGIGAVRRKPEIKYKNPDDFNSLPEIQYRIAENALNYLEIGGELVYSTCTLRKAENDGVVKEFLKIILSLKLFRSLKSLESLSEAVQQVFFRRASETMDFISKFRKVR